MFLSRTALSSLTFVQMKKLFGALAAVGAAGYCDVFFAVSVVEQPGNKMSLLRNWFVAYWTFPPDSRFHLGIAVRAAHYDAKLMRYVHGAVDSAVQVHSLGKKCIAQRT